MSIIVKWPKNHGAVVTRRVGPGKVLERFVRPNGTLSVKEAAAALETNDMRIYRLAEAGKVKTRVIAGETRVLLSEVKRLRDNPQAMYPGRGERA